VALAPTTPQIIPSPAVNQAFGGVASGYLSGPPLSGFYGGADYLFLRMHFSEAIAFVRVTDSLQNGLPHEHARAQEINFNYNSAFRTFVGYRVTPNSAVQVTFFHFGTDVSVNDTVRTPGSFAIDAFSDRANIGQSIATNSSVRLNVFDLDYVHTLTAAEGRLGFRLAAGVRLADVRQHYDSTTFDATGAMMGQGIFNTHFIGAGPHLGLQAQGRSRPDSPFSLVARGGASFLVGGYDVSSGAVFTGLGGADQEARRTLTVPVLEAELGAAWQPTPTLTFSAGWLVQAWWDLGVSGGNNGGKFIEVDAANIMSFDGLFVRSTLRY
jgi:hypothetical protein